MTKWSHAAEPPRRFAAIPRTTMWLLVNSVVVAGGGFVFWIITARRFDPSTVGSVAATAAFFPLIGTIGALGLGETIIRHLPEWTDRRRVVLGLSAIVGAVSVLVGVVWAIYLAHSIPLTRSVVVLFPLMAATLAVGVLADSTNLALRLPQWIVVSNLVGIVPKLSVGLFAASPSMLLVGLAAGSLAATLVGLGAANLALRRRQPEGTEPASRRGGPNVRTAVRAALAESRRFAMSNWVAGLVALVPAAFIPAIVARRLGTSAAAWVAIPMMMLALLNMPASASSRTLFAEASATPSRLRVLARRAAVHAATMTVLAAIAAVLFGPLLLRLLGTDYSEESTGVLRWIALAAVAAVPNYVGDAVLNVRRDVLGFAIANIAGTTAILSAAIVATGRDVTAVGLAIFIGQIVYAVIVWTIIILRRHHPRREVASSRPCA